MSPRCTIVQYQAFQAFKTVPRFILPYFIYQENIVEAPFQREIVLSFISLFSVIGVLCCLGYFSGFDRIQVGIGKSQGCYRIRAVARTNHNQAKQTIQLLYFTVSTLEQFIRQPSSILFVTNPNKAVCHSCVLKTKLWLKVEFVFLVNTLINKQDSFVSRQNKGVYWFILSFNFF